MTARRGWCPTVFAPMPSGDGFLVRVKPSLATLTLTGARALAEAALSHGNGVLNLTNRANLQVRGLAENLAASFAAKMVAAGLADPDPAAERRRNVIVSPLAGDDPDVAPTTRAVADAVVRMLVEDSRLAALPDKFGVAVDGGGALALGDVAASVRVRLYRDAASVAAGENSVGYVSYRNLERGAFGFAPPFGQMTGRALLALADLAESSGADSLRVTPWRTILIPGISGAIAQELREGGAAAGFIVDPDDARLRIIACPGFPSCARASVPTLADAARLAASVPNAARVHVAGCAKGCAHPRAAPVTFVGIEGRYAIVRDGRAGDAPTAWAA